MSWLFEHLDEVTWAFMVEEIELDSQSGRLYLGAFLSAVGRADWKTLLIEAAVSGTEISLALRLSLNGRLHTMTQRTIKGISRLVRVPSNAAEMLSEGEFNRFYIRAVCRRAEKAALTYVEAYRAKSVLCPRPESEARIGKRFAPADVLEDLRLNPGVDVALGIPGGVNSGLSIRLCCEAKIRDTETLINMAR